MTVVHITADDLAQGAAGLRDEWRADAACRGRGRVMDPPAHRRTRTAIADAKAICARCPVLTECTAWVLALPPAADPGGVCAGLTEAERSGRRQVVADPGLPDGYKRCRRCLAIKPLDGGFYRDRRNTDGRNSYCKPCNSHNRKKART